MTDSVLALVGVGVAVLVFVVAVFAGRWLSRFLRKRAALADRLVVALVKVRAEQDRAEQDRAASEYLARYRRGAPAACSAAAYRMSGLPVPGDSSVSSASALFRSTGHFAADGSDGFER